MEFSGQYFKAKLRICNFFSVQVQCVLPLGPISSSNGIGAPCVQTTYRHGIAGRLGDCRGKRACPVSIATKAHTQLRTSYFAKRKRLIDLESKQDGIRVTSLACALLTKYQKLVPVGLKCLFHPVAIIFQISPIHLKKNERNIYRFVSCLCQIAGIPQNKCSQGDPGLFRTIWASRPNMHGAIDFYRQVPQNCFVPGRKEYMGCCCIVEGFYVPRKAETLDPSIPFQ